MNATGQIVQTRAKVTCGVNFVLNQSFFAGVPSSRLPPLLTDGRAPGAAGKSKLFRFSIHPISPASACFAEPTFSTLSPAGTEGQQVDDPLSNTPDCCVSSRDAKCLDEFRHQNAPAPPFLKCLLYTSSRSNSSDFMRCTKSSAAFSAAPARASASSSAASSCGSSAEAAPRQGAC